MRWYKNYSDNYRGRSVERLFEEMGHVGVACYFLFMEICTEKMELRTANGITEVSPKLNFGLTFVRRNLRISRTKLEDFLTICSGLGLFSYKISEKELEIEIPILLELLDSDSKRSRSRRATDAANSRLEGDGDKDKHGDKDKESTPEEKKPVDHDLPPLAKLWNDHCGKLAKVTKTNAARNKKAAARFAEDSPAAWRETIIKLANSSFAAGNNKNGWKATFDFILQPEARLKILEGMYDQAQNKRFENERDIGDPDAEYQKMLEEAANGTRN